MRGNNVFHTYEEMPDLEAKYEVGGYVKFYYKSTPNVQYPHSNYFDLSPRIPNGAVPHIEKFFPYFADVTQDLPSSIKFEPKTWKRCQLMAEKHGGYMQFLHHETGEVLRIAMNSNYYEPVN